MKIIIRAILPEDAAMVNRLSEQLGYPHALSETEKRIEYLLHNPNDCILIAAAEDKVIGWLHVYKATWLESGIFAEIAGLVVDEEHRGKNIGRLLVQAACSWATEQKVSVLSVRSNVSRTRAHQFYLRAGFREMKESKVFEMQL